MKWPCPNGYHVPSKDEWEAVKTVWTTLGGWGNDWTNFGIALKVPLAGSRNSSSADTSSQGSYGLYWSSTRYNTSDAYKLYLGLTNLTPWSRSSRASGHSVRAFKNSPVVPDGTWTTLKSGTGSAWIFWSSSLWLISMSWDWTTWITIADKNVWATTVWNSWDTLSEANCGKYFQRWNNYWFDWTWTLADTSSTQVDASNYWPWNYYSSGTFIKYNWSWDSSDNANLWWWVSQLTYKLITNTDTNTPISVTLASASWSSKTITVTATWVTASNTVIVSPTPSSMSDYVWGWVYCTAQWSNSLTFTCDTEPTNDITVNVVILN